jgi:hypothetical protein
MFNPCGILQVLHCCAAIFNLQLPGSRLNEYIVWVLSCHWHTKMPVFNFLLSLQFPNKNKPPPASLVLKPPLWPLAIPLKLTYFVNSLIPFSINLTYRNSWYSNVWILCLFSIA